jgi:Domain of unknown function (DUF4062)
VRVFVSSTLQELADERHAVREAVTRLRLVPVMFELGAPAAPAAAGLPRLPGTKPGLRWRVLAELWISCTGLGHIGLEDEYLPDTGC